MTGVAGVLVAWLVVTVASAALLALVVAAQGALGVVARRRSGRRRTGRSHLPAADAGGPVSRAGGSPGPR